MPDVLCAPLKGLPLELGIGARGQKTRVMVLPDGQKSFGTGLAIQTVYRRVTDTQPRCHSKDHASIASCR